MKVLLTGKNSKDIEALVKNLGFEVVSDNPDVILSYGGDGTLLASERKYPEVPKLPLRDSKVCKKCSEHGEEVLLKKLIQGKMELKEYTKLETTVDGKILLALNDFVIRNKDAIHSIRFRVIYPERAGQVEGLLIGDGIVVSTPFGSSGYFKSVTGLTFDSGFGIAFNNLTEKLEPKFFDGSNKVVFKLIRGQAALTFDNSPDIYLIPESMEITFKLSDQKAKIYELQSLHCTNCQVQRG